MTAPEGGRAFRVGETHEWTRTVADEDVRGFARVTGDDNPVHLDDAYAAKTRFGGRVVHGMLTAGLVSAVLGSRFPGPGTVYLEQTLRFLRPVRVGATVKVVVAVLEWRPEKRVMKLSTRVLDGAGAEVLTGEAVVLAGG